MRYLSVSVVRTAAAVVILSLGYASGRSDDARTRSSGSGVTLGGRVQKTCARCGHEVPATSKIGDRCPFCGVTWGGNATRVSGRAQAMVHSSPSVVATVRPVATSLSGRIRQLDAAINGQDSVALGDILAVNFVLLGRDGRVQLDSDRYLETAITDAVATSISRRTALLSTKTEDGEVIATVRVYSKRYPPDAKPEYSTTYEQETWTTEGLAPRLRLVKPIPAPRARK